MSLNLTQSCRYRTVLRAKFRKWLWKMILWLCQTTVIASAVTATIHQPQRHLGMVRATGHNPVKFLEHYGYLPANHLLRNFRLSRRKAVSLYQHLNGLKVTGKLNHQTWQLMQQPRCGNLDVGVRTLPMEGMEKYNRGKRQASTKAEKLTTYEYRWLQKNISWRPTRFLDKMPIHTQWRALRNAFDTWSEPSQLTLNFEPTIADIRVAFFSREHGDGDSNAFDGKGLLLAHAFPPGDVELAGDIHFDADESWTVDSEETDSLDLAMIALHEVGHAVGLSHSMKKEDIMYPLYGTHISNPGLSKNDARRLQSLYGRNPAFKWIPRAKSLLKISTPMTSPKWCHMHFNDVIRGPNGQGYIFSGRYVYRFNEQGVENGYPVHVHQEFPLAPINALAVVHVHEGARTYFFKDNRFWRFSGYTLDQGYPKHLATAFPERPDAALNIPDRDGHSKIFIMGEQFFWLWSFHNEDVSSSFLLIKDYWGGIPPKIDAAVLWSDNYLYFFRHKKYYKLSKDNHDILPGYPKIKGPAWLGGKCGYDVK